MTARTRCWAGCWLIAAVLPLLAAGCQGKLVGIGEELRLGREAARMIEREFPVCKDSELQWLVERIGRQVAANSTRPEIDFTFRVLDVREINALSVPGYVYLNRGLITAVNADPDEVAGVIAHEIAHTTERHMAKQIERIYGANFLLTALSPGSNTTELLAEIGLTIALNGYSRQDERAADAQALRFMARAGYDPWALVRFFEQLQKETGDVRGLNKYFATHPSTSDRITRARAQIRAERLAREAAAPPSEARSSQEGAR